MLLSLFENIEDFIEQLKIDENKRELINSQTIEQRNNPLWFKERRIRLTASNFGKISKKRQSTHCRGLVYNILYANEEQDLDYIEAIKYGKENEEFGKKTYEEKSGNIVEKSGLWVHLVYPWLAWSPDGLIEDNGEQGLFEVKWIAAKNFRNETILNYTKNYKKSCLFEENGTITLKKSHDYYFQIQGQLFITKRSFCDLAIFTKIDYHIERIVKDEGFFLEKCFEKLKIFYFLAYLPEIILKNYVKKKNIIDLTRRTGEEIINNFIDKMH